MENVEKYIEELPANSNNKDVNTEATLEKKEQCKEGQEYSPNREATLEDKSLSDVNLTSTESLQNILQDTQLHSEMVPKIKEDQCEVVQQGNQNNAHSSNASFIAETAEEKLQDGPFDLDFLIEKKEQQCEKMKNNAHSNVICSTTGTDPGNNLEHHYSDCVPEKKADQCEEIQKYKENKDSTQTKNLSLSNNKTSINNAIQIEVCTEKSDVCNYSLALNLLKQYNSEESESEVGECYDADMPIKNSTLSDNKVPVDAAILNTNMYREEIISDSDQDNSDVECIIDQRGDTKDDVEEDDDDECITKDGENPSNRKSKPPKVHGELLLEDLPPIQDLHITVAEQECEQFGQVHSIVEQLVLVSALPLSPLLNLDTVLFLDKGQRVLGEIFDVCGPVSEPLYCIRFNSNDQIKEKNIAVGDIVYVAPKTEHTQYVILSSLMKMRGSDASWEHDIEPPPRYLDYSDDEEERKARQIFQKSKRMIQHNCKSDSSDEDNGHSQKEAPIANKCLRNQHGRRNARTANFPRPQRQNPSIKHPYQNSWHSNYACNTPEQFPRNNALTQHAVYPAFCATPPPMIYSHQPFYTVRPPSCHIKLEPPPPIPYLVRNPFNIRSAPCRTDVIKTPEDQT